MTGSHSTSSNRLLVGLEEVVVVCAAVVVLVV